MGKLGDFQTEFRTLVRELRAGGMEDEYVKRQVADELVRETGDERWVNELQAQVGIYVAQVPKVEGDVILTDGTVTRCRMDSSTMWLIYAPRAVNRNRKGNNVIGMEAPSDEEKGRWGRAVDASMTFGRPTNLEPRTAGSPHPEGWFDARDAYRNEADEAAVLSR